MAHCANPGCSRGDVTGDDLWLEFMSRDSVWVPVCDKHTDPDNPTIRLTEGVRETPFEVLTQIKDDLQ